MSAMQAINRFLEAEHHYTKLTDIEIGNGSQVADVELPRFGGRLMAFGSDRLGMGSFIVNR